MRQRRVRCPNSRLGCDARFALEDGVDHLSACAFRTVQCPACKKPQTAEALPRHVARCYRACDACGVAVPRADATHHVINLCLAKPRSWRSNEEAQAFTRWRDASHSEISWVVAHCSHVVDWQKLHTACSQLLAQRAQREEDTPSTAEAAVTWGALAAQCHTRWWRGMRLAFSLQAVELEPTNADALLALADAQLQSGKAAEALETFGAYGSTTLLVEGRMDGMGGLGGMGGMDGIDHMVGRGRLGGGNSVAGEIEVGGIEAMVGKARALTLLGREVEARTLWQQSAAVPLSAGPPGESSARARFVVAAARAKLALGETSGAEEMMTKLLAGAGWSRADEAELIAVHAEALQDLYLNEITISAEGDAAAAAAAAPTPVVSNEGREYLSTAFSCWEGLLKARCGIWRREGGIW